MQQRGIEEVSREFFADKGGNTAANTDGWVCGGGWARTGYGSVGAENLVTRKRKFGVGGKVCFLDNNDVVRGIKEELLQLK